MSVLTVRARYPDREYMLRLAAEMGVEDLLVRPFHEAELKGL